MTFHLSRRRVLAGSAFAAGSLPLLASASAQSPPLRRRWADSYSGQLATPAPKPGVPDQDYRPTITPGGATLPYRLVDGVKVYHLVAQSVEHEFCPGLVAQCWGYNGHVHGPTLEAVEGDRVRVYLTNRLAAPTTLHWHGVFLPSGMDGVGGLTQPAVMPGETFRYEWTFRQHGTFMYHSHHDEMTQMAMGMTGMIVVHPRNAAASHRVDRDFVIMLSEWSIAPGAARPDPNAMAEFNVLTMNAKAHPGTPSLVCRTGDRVRIRLGNLSAMDHHSIHLHGYYFRVVATDGGQIPDSAQWPETTVIVPTGSTRDIEFVADAPGDWAMHCHMTHHVMNQMGHEIPNMIGVDPQGFDERARKIAPGYMTMGHTGMGDMGDMNMRQPTNSVAMLGSPGPFGAITMGGMFTILKVRDEAHETDPGWYAHPDGTLARLASTQELQEDGIDVA